MKLPSGVVVKGVHDAVLDCGKEEFTVYDLTSYMRNIIPPENAVRAWRRRLSIECRWHTPKRRQREWTLSEEVTNGINLLIGETLNNSIKQQRRHGSCSLMVERCGWRGRMRVWRLIKPSPTPVSPPPTEESHETPGRTSDARDSTGPSL